MTARRHITVLAVKGSRVRIGIHAPRSVAVDREEIFERKRNESAARQPDEAGHEPGAAEVTAKS